MAVRRLIGRARAEAPGALAELPLLALGLVLCFVALLGAGIVLR